MRQHLFLAYTLSLFLVNEVNGWLAVLELQGKFRNCLNQSKLLKEITDEYLQIWTQIPVNNNRNQNQREVESFAWETEAKEGSRNDLNHLLSMHLQGRERSRVNCSSCEAETHNYTHTNLKKCFWLFFICLFVHSFFLSFSCSYLKCINVYYWIPYYLLLILKPTYNTPFTCLSRYAVKYEFEVKKRSFFS